MARILEFPVIPQLDWGISSQRILKFRHCEGAKRPKQSLGILEFLVEFCAGILDLGNSSLRNSRILSGIFLGILDLGILG